MHSMTCKTKIESPNLSKYAVQSSAIALLSVLAALVVGNMVSVEAFAETNVKTDCITTANTQVKIGNYQKAIECYKAVLDTDPNNFLAHTGLAVAFAGLEKFADAREQIDQALRLQPEDPRALNALAMIQYKTNWTSEAKQTYKHVLSSHPYNTDANTGIGNVFRLLGETQRATFHYWLADENSVTGSFDARNGFGIMHREIFLQHDTVGNLDTAIFYHQLAIDIDPTSVDGWNGMGNALVDKGRVLDQSFCVNAIESYTESLKIYEQNLDALIGLGNALNCLGKYHEAVVYFEQALKIESENRTAQKGKEIALAATD